MHKKSETVGMNLFGLSFLIVICFVVFPWEDILADHEAAGVSETQFVEQGYQHLQQGNYERALEFFDQAVSQEGPSYMALLGRGQTLYRLNRLDEAIEAASQAIKLNPRIPFGYMLRATIYEDEFGEILLANDDLTEAITQLSVFRNEEFVANKPILGNLYTARAVGLTKLGRLEEALADLETAMELGGDPVSIFSQRGRAYTKLGQYEQAIQHYSQALQLESSDSFSLFNRGAVYRCIGQSRKAIEDLTHLLSLDPKDSEAHIERAFAFSHIEQFDQAVSDFDVALRHGKEDPDIYLELSSIYYRQGHLAKALDANEKAIQLDANHEIPFGYFQRGYYLLELKDIVQAQTAFEQGIHWAVEKKDPLALQDSLEDLEEWLTSSERSEQSTTVVVKEIIQALTEAQGKIKEEDVRPRACLRH